MVDLAEKRVYDERTGATDLVVAAARGLAVVSVSDDRVGEFGLVRRFAPNDVAVATNPIGRLAVATDDDVLVASDLAPDALESSGFGPACRVTFVDGRPLAGAPDGRIGILGDRRWTTVGELPTAPTALAGDLVGTEDGIFRLVGDELQPAGLIDVTGIAHAAGVPLAATSDGLYALGNGWLDELSGDFQLVAGAPDGRAHAATRTVCFERRASAWQSIELPSDGPVAAIAYGDRAYVCTKDGDLLIDGGDGWRVHSLGLEGVVGAAVI